MKKIENKYKKIIKSLSEEFVTSEESYKKQLKEISLLQTKADETKKSIDSNKKKQNTLNKYMFVNSCVSKDLLDLKAKLKELKTHIKSEDITVKQLHSYREDINLTIKEIKKNCNHSIVSYEETSPSYTMGEDPSWGNRTCLVCGLSESGDGEKDYQFKILKENENRLMFHYRNIDYRLRDKYKFGYNFISDTLLTFSLQEIKELCFTPLEKKIILDLIGLKQL